MLAQAIKDACSTDHEVAVPGRHWFHTKDFRLVCAAGRINPEAVTALLAKVFEAPPTQRQYLGRLLAKRVLTPSEEVPSL